MFVFTSSNRNTAYYSTGVVSIQAGGVGRNIAEALTRLGIETVLVAPIGDDAAAETLKQQCKSFKMVLNFF